MRRDFFEPSDPATRVRYRGGWVYEGTMCGVRARITIDDAYQMAGGYPVPAVEERHLLTAHLRAQGFLPDEVLPRAIGSQKAGIICDHPGCGERLDGSYNRHMHLVTNERPRTPDMMPRDCQHPWPAPCHQDGPR